MSAWRSGRKTTQGVLVQGKFPRDSEHPNLPDSRVDIILSSTMDTTSTTSFEMTTARPLVKSLTLVPTWDLDGLQDYSRPFTKTNKRAGIMAQRSRKRSVIRDLPSSKYSVTGWWNRCSSQTLRRARMPSSLCPAATVGPSTVIIRTSTLSKSILHQMRLIGEQPTQSNTNILGKLSSIYTAAPTTDSAK